MICINKLFNNANLIFPYSKKKVIFKFINKSFSSKFQNPLVNNLEYVNLRDKIKYTSYTLFLFSFLSYFFMLRKFNMYCLYHKFYFYNTFLTNKLSLFNTNRLKLLLSNVLIIKESKEYILIESVIYSIINTNNNRYNKELLKENPNFKLNIILYQSDSIGSYLSYNGDFFISTGLIKHCNYNRYKIKLFLCCEIANYLLGNVPNRDKLMLLYEYIYKKNIYQNKFIGDSDRFDNIKLFSNLKEKIVSRNLNKNKSFNPIYNVQLTRFNKYFLFYPENEHILSNNDVDDVVKLGIKIYINSLPSISNFENTNNDRNIDNSKNIDNSNTKYNMFNSIEAIKDFDKMLENYEMSYITSSDKYNKLNNTSRFINVLNRL